MPEISEVTNEAQLTPHPPERPVSEIPESACGHCNGKGYLSMRNRVQREQCEFCEGRGHSPRQPLVMISHHDNDDDDN